MAVKLRIHTGKVENTGEASWLASDTLQVVIKSHLNSILFLHFITFGKPEVSILKCLNYLFLVFRFYLLHT